MKDWIKDIVISVAVAVIILQFVEPTRVSGISMLPNFEEQDYLILSKQAYEKEDIERGDVIVFKSHLLDQKGKEKKLIKRVIGLPGETVTVKNGKVFVDGEEIDESYTNDGITNGELNVTVPEGTVFCMGDNRMHSTDSRSSQVGCIDVKSIEGKVVFRLLPFSEFGRIE